MKNIPEKGGYYYHYKHDPAGSVENYAYYVLGVAKHSEDDTELVIYQPLYKTDYFEGVDYSARPLEMFMDMVTKEGETFPRFAQITDPEIVNKLKKIQSNISAR